MFFCCMVDGHTHQGYNFGFKGLNGKQVLFQQNKNPVQVVEHSGFLSAGQVKPEPVV